MRIEGRLRSGRRVRRQKIGVLRGIEMGSGRRGLRRGRSGGERLRSWRGARGNELPERGDAAAIAGAEDAVVGSADICFDAGVVNFFASVAGGAEKRDEAELLFRFADGRKVDLPKIEVHVKEGDAVSVQAGLLADLADDADVGFLVFFRPAEDEFLFGRKLVAREDAGAVKAEKDGGGALGEHAAVQIGADEDDGDLFRDTSRAAHRERWASGRPWRAGGRNNLVPGEKEVES